MTPTTLRYSSLLVFLLPLVAAGAQPLHEIASWSKAPENCERRALVQYLRHDDVRVRSAALDVLEQITGKDFGLDPWAQPSAVPEAVQQALDAWAAAEELAGDPAAAPEQEQLVTTVALLQTADPDTRRRICLRFAPWRAALSAALQRELEHNARLEEKARDNLRCALFRLQLQNAIPEDVGHVATLLTSHARNDMLEGLEALRSAGKDALPVLMQFADATDGLIREVAVDVLLQTGGVQAFKILMPRLMHEADRNILQIAARRAPDCEPIVPLIAFLNKCALAEDEDVAVAALEALADMEADDDDEEEDKRSTPLAGAAHALSAGDFLRLLQSPNWRVRASALRALQNKGSFLPSISDAALQAGLVHALLEDTDETVRTQAMHVLHRRKLVSRYLTELTEYAVRTPSATPYLVYLYCAQRAPLTPALEDAVRRFSPEQVEQLAQYDNEYETVFDESGVRRKTVKAVLAALLANPDPRVKRRIMTAWGDDLFTAGQVYAEAFLAWLQAPVAPVEDKVKALRQLVFYGISSGDRDSEAVVSLCNWLQQELDAPTTQDSAMQSMVYASLLHLSPARAEGLLDERVEKLEMEIISELLEDNPQYLLKMRREFVAKILQHESFYAFSYLLNSENGGGAEMTELLASLPLDEERRISLLERELTQLRHMRDSEENTTAPLFPALNRALSADSPMQNRADAAFLLQGNIPEPRRAEHQQLLSAADAVVSTVQEPCLSALKCLVESPKKAEEVLPWAQKYGNSPCAEVRRAVAGCLLPVESWCFYLPRIGENTAPLKTEAPISHRFPEGKRVSCPVALIRLVQDMQQDEDPAVALTACGAMLYRTGDCNRARMAELLAWLKNLQKEYAESRGENEVAYNTRRSLCSQMEGVWRRWSDYRSGVEEFFKLKGSPKKLRPGLEALLAEFAAATDEYPWSIIEEVKDKMPSRRSASRVAGAPQAHEFDFPGAAEVAQPSAPTPHPVESEQVELADAEEPEPSHPAVAADAPVRVEFFHKDGCDVCKRVQSRLEHLRSAYPGLEVVEYDVESEAGRARNTVLCARFGVPPKDRRKAPTLFAEAGVLLGEEAASERLDVLVKESHAAGQNGQRLAASPDETVPPSPAPPTVPTEPAVAPQPQPSTPVRLAESSAAESSAAEEEQFLETLRSYAVLVVGAVVALLGALLLLFGRRKEE